MALTTQRTERVSRLKKRRRGGLAGLPILTAALMMAGAAGWPRPLDAQIAPVGQEFSVLGALPGDQLHPAVDFDDAGGYLVWEDNFTDGYGLGISARRLNSSLSGDRNAFRVNETAEGDQERPDVAILKDGTAVVVWQGGLLGAQKIYARFILPDGTFATGDIRVSEREDINEQSASATPLADGNVLVVWSGFDDDPETREMENVYGQKFSALGEKLGSAFKIHNYSQLNQRTPAVGALSDGGFLVTWISEKHRSTVNNTPLEGQEADATSGGEKFWVDVYARRFDARSAPIGNEFLVNVTTNITAHPNVAVAPDDSFLIAWSQLGSTISTNSWDVCYRTFDSNGQPSSDEIRANTYQYGDQYAPQIGSVANGFLIAWTSVGQDGSLEGIFGRFVDAQDGPADAEIQINTSTVYKQIHPAVASNNNDLLGVVWSGFQPGGSSFDLFAQRLAIGAPGLSAPEPPYVSALSTSKLSVAWPELSGYDVAEYLLYVDGAEEPLSLEDNSYVASGLPAGSEHSFALAYKLSDGTVSDKSASVSATTWGEDGNFNGLPDDWESGFWGDSSRDWPGGQVDSDGDGASNLEEFLAGTDPTDPESILKLKITNTPQGPRLFWSTRPGFFYRVESSADLSEWTSITEARFAVGSEDSIPAAAAGDVAYYRLVQLR